MNIYQKIKAIMEDVQYLAKDDRVDTGKGRGYKAISEEKVTSTVRASMLKHGVVIVPDVRYRIQNADDSEDYIEAVSSGTGVDTQDKGVGKAMTYAYKYLLLRTFAIPTGEDPDKISSDIYTDELNKGKQDKPQFTPNVYEPDRKGELQTGPAQRPLHSPVTWGIRGRAERPHPVLALPPAVRQLPGQAHVTGDVPGIPDGALPRLG